MGPASAGAARSRPRAPRRGGQFRPRPVDAFRERFGLGGVVADLGFGHGQPRQPFIYLFCSNCCLVCLAAVLPAGNLTPALVVIGAELSRASS